MIAHEDPASRAVHGLQVAIDHAIEVACADAPDALTALRRGFAIGKVVGETISAMQGREPLSGGEADPEVPTMLQPWAS